MQHLSLKMEQNINRMSLASCACLLLFKFFTPPPSFLGRTFPGHTYFASPLGPGQLALFNLLKAYSLLDPEVGYCQGLSFVAGILLLHVSFTYSKIDL